MRGFIVVLDSFGVGEAPDAKSFGDEGASTIKTISKSKYFEVPNMQKMGLLAIDGVGLDNSAQCFIWQVKGAFYRQRHNHRPLGNGRNYI